MNTQSRPSRWLLPLLPLLGLLSPALAAEGNEQDELQHLLELIAEQTEIATKTRLNADYVPGLVSVLHGDELRNRGVRTVWEALGLVPGIELSIEETGRKQVVVRGVGRTYASGNVKLLLDGVSMNSAQVGLADPLLNMPLAQVERIEVVRGPGSAIHGEFAFAGVINVITRQGQDELHAAIANDNGYTAGANLAYTTGEWHMNLNLAGAGTDGDEVEAGPDLLHPDYASFSNAPGPSNEQADYRAALFDLDHRDFALKLHLLENGMGDHFGINHELPPAAGDIVTRYRYLTAEITQGFSLSPMLSSRLTLGWQENRETKDDLFVDPAEFWGSVGDPDIVLDSQYREHRYYGALDLTWKGWREHTLFTEFSLADIQVDAAWMKLNLDPASYLPSTEMYDYGHLIAEQTTRRIRSLTVQDEYRATDAVTLTAGLRYDHYSDAGDSLNPRLAAVWRLRSRHILKAQYARAFRPPTFYELGGEITDIDPATLDTAELAYIYRSPQTVARAVLFRSHIDNLVVFVDDAGTLGFDTVKACAHGLELELEQQLGRHLRFNGNLGYTDTYDASTHESLAFASNWLGNLGLAYRVDADLLFSLDYRYVGERQRQVGDSRDPLDTYESIDATLSLFNLGARDLSLRAGGKNIFDQDIRYPAPLGTYEDDYPRPGRQWWLELDYRY